MRSYSIPEKTVRKLKVMYNGSECIVIDYSSVCDWLEIKTGIQLGYEKDHQTWKYRHQTKLSNFLEDLDFADDLALIYSSRSHIQTKVSNLGCYAKIWTS